MTRFSLWLVALTASFGLAAGQAAQEKPKLDYSPIELQVGASFVAYDTQLGAGPTGAQGNFTPKGLGMAPSLKVSVDMIPFKIGKLDASVLFSGSWRFANDVPFECDRGYGKEAAPADLQHRSQMSLGALLKVNIGKRLDVGIGVDERQDWLFADGTAGTDSEDSVWRPWLRAQARYLFDRGTSVTPFIGAEFAFAMSAVEIDPANYYRDYFINTGQSPLGAFTDLTPSPESFGRGHAPLWELAVVGGVRFGRHCR